MAADMVASITLRLRDQMSAGIDEIKREFGSVQTTLDKLTVVLGDLQGTLDALRMPGAINQSLKGTIGEADAAARAVTSIGMAADANIGRFREMNAALSSGGAARGSAAGAHGGGHSGAAIDYIGGAIAGIGGLDAIKAQAEFQNPLLHSAITEKLSAADAMKEVARLQTQLQSLALTTATSSQALAEAQLFLITTGMSKQLIGQMMPALAQTSTAYNVPVGDMTQAAFTLSENLKIAANQMLPALGMLAYAGKIGHFNLGDFGMYLPTVAGKAGSIGISGARGEDTLASALEIIRRNEGSSGQAATDLHELLNYMTSNMGTRMFDMTKKMRDLLGKGGRELFEKYHIKPLDLPTFYNAERLKGIDPVNAMADYFEKTLAGIKSPTDRGLLIGALLHNVGAQNAMLALTQYGPDFKKDQATLSHVNPMTVQTDFATAMQGSITQVRLFDEEMAQLERDIGAGLLPLLEALNYVLIPVINTIDVMNKVTIPGLDVGLGNLTAGAAAAYASLRIFAGLKAGFGGKAAAAAEGAGGRSLLGGAVGVAADLGLAGTGVVGATALGVAGVGYLNSRVIADQMKRNTEAIDRNTAAHEKFHVAGPGMLYQDGPGGPVMLPVPQMHLGGAHPAGPMLNRP